MFGSVEAATVLKGVQVDIQQKIAEISGYFGGKEQAEQALEQIMSHLPKQLTPGTFEIVIEAMFLLFTIHQFSRDLEQNQARLEKSVLYARRSISESRDSNHREYPSPQ